jgi:hypothetical protein
VQPGIGVESAVAGGQRRADLVARQGVAQGGRERDGEAAGERGAVADVDDVVPVLVEPVGQARLPGRDDRRPRGQPLFDRQADLLDPTAVGPRYRRVTGAPAAQAQNSSTRGPEPITSSRAPGTARSTVGQASISSRRPLRSSTTPTKTARSGSAGRGSGAAAGSSSETVAGTPATKGRRA